MCPGGRAKKRKTPKKSKETKGDDGFAEIIPSTKREGKILRKFADGDFWAGVLQRSCERKIRKRQRFS